jgi:anti-sigma B factor antagonist
MRFEENRVGNILIAKVLDSRIAADVAPSFRADLIEYINSGNRSIILDMGAVSFIDSSGLGALVSSLKAIGSDGDLVLSGTRNAVVSTFKLTRMDRVFRMFGTNEEAIAALS